MQGKANAELELEVRVLERESTEFVRAERQQIGMGGMAPQSTANDRVYQPSDDPDRLPNRMLMHVERVLGQSADAMWASFEDKMARVNSVALVIITCNKMARVDSDALLG